MERRSRMRRSIIDVVSNMTDPEDLPGSDKNAARSQSRKTLRSFNISPVTGPAERDARNGLSLGEDFESSLGFLRENIIGRNRILSGPYGQRLKLYMDYTASGQGLQFITDYMTWIRGNFANTHTEDSATGLFMTRALDEAKHCIEDCVNAQDKFVAICTGTGCSGALLRLQQILGVYIPPASWALLGQLLGTRSAPSRKERVSLKIIPNCNVVDHGSIAGEIPEWLEAREAVKKSLRERGELPLVVVGGYEHHSNELSWREGLCDVVRIPLTKSFELDLAFLEKTLREHRAATPERRIIASISACSNVTGMRTNIPVVSRLVRRFNALYFVDFAASGPYQDIDCNPPGQENLFDGFVLSPHKFLGGEGSCGLLMLRKSVYDLRLPPTFAGGGTVKFVGQHLHSYHDDIMEREDAGTPGALQIYQCSMAFAVKDSLGPKNIEERELDLLTDFFEWLKDTHRKNVFILGNRDPARRVAIISFNVIGPQPLHPRFVTVLLSDLFGIQSRAGCSCAGPHGVDLFGASAKHERAWASYVVGEQRGRIEEVDDIGLYSIKPGWCRINLHYTLDGDDIWYLKQALSFVVENGARFLPLYSWDAITGCWAFNPPNSFHEVFASSGDDEYVHKFGLQTAMEGGTGRILTDASQRRPMFEWQLRKAEDLLPKLPPIKKLAPPPAPFPDMRMPSQGPQPFFVVAEEQVQSMEDLKRCMALHAEHLKGTLTIQPKLSPVAKAPQSAQSVSLMQRLGRGIGCGSASATKSSASVEPRSNPIVENEIWV